MNLPFKQKDIYLGLAEISGLLRIANNMLEIEYKVKDTTLGLMDSSVKNCHLSIHIIDSVEIKKGWFNSKLTFTFNRIPDLDNPFQLEDNTLIVSLKKKDLHKAETFRSRLMHQILERKLDDLHEEDKELDDQETEPKKSSEKESSSSSRKTARTNQKRSGTDGLENMLREE